MRDLNRGPMRNIGTAYEPIDPAILALAARYGHDPEAVLPIFQELQTRYGGLTDKIVSDVARSLGIPTAQAQGVASFYALLSTSMRPPHTLRICDSPPCWLRGAAQVHATAEQALGAAWAVERTSCLGQCDRAPMFQRAARLKSTFGALCWLELYGCQAFTGATGGCAARIQPDRARFGLQLPEGHRY